MTGIQNLQSTTYTYAAQSVASVAETEKNTEASVSTVASYDSYTPSDAALATIADTEAEDTTVEDTTVEADKEVETDDEVVEDEKEDSSDTYGSYSDFSLSGMDSANMKISMMTSQHNTLATMLNTLNVGNDSVTNQSWFADALTFSYAGKYLANTAAGNYGPQDDSEETTEVESTIEYNNYNMDGYQAPESDEDNTSSETTED